MKEYMFFIRKKNDSVESLSPYRHLKFLKSCENYINNLKSKGQLISAQPIEYGGKVISGQNGKIINKQLRESLDFMGGYYHILAKDLEEATEIAMSNPEFEYNDDTIIEVRPIKAIEQITGFVYPN